MAMLSAHRGGAGDGAVRENSLAAIERAVAWGCDHVELDVRLTCDGHPVLWHGPTVEVDGVERTIAEATRAEVGDALADLAPALALVAGRARVHLDLKVAHDEVRVVQQVLDAVGVGGVVVTTAEDDSILLLREWSRAHAPDLLLGLSTSARSYDGSRRSRLRVRCASFFPRWRMRRAGVDVVVAHRVVARWWLRRWTARRGLLLLVWTVDEADELERWLRDPLCWLVTSNRPERGLAVRAAFRRAAGGARGRTAPPTP